MEQTPEQLRAAAAKLEDAKEESFQRCDTDGFVSQWAFGLTAQVKRLQADIVEAGGISQFTGLFTLEGQRVRAKLIKTRYGTAWAFCDEQDKFTGKFINAFPQKPETMAKKGYREDDEMAPARAKVLGGQGRGLSGAATCYAGIIRTDKGYPDNAVVER